MKNHLLTLFALSLAASSQAATLISDNFDSIALGGSINGTTPAISNAGGAWVAPTSSFTGNGAGALSTTYVVDNARSGMIDLGANHLSTNKGVYELSMSVTHPSGSSGTNWIGLGFANNNSVTSNLVANNGNPWMIYRLSGNVTVFGGNAVTNPRATDITSAVHGGALGAMNTLRLVLDTSSTNWVLRAFMNDFEFDLDTAAPGNSYTFAANPTSRYVGFSNGPNNATTTVSTIDNFQLNFTPIPEPSAAFLGLLGCGGLLLRRRR